MKKHRLAAWLLTVAVVLTGCASDPPAGSSSVQTGGTSSESSAESGRIRTEMDADAWMYGTSTTKEFTAHKKPVLKGGNPAALKDDFVADDHAELYVCFN